MEPIAWITTSIDCATSCRCWVVTARSCCAIISRWRWTATRRFSFFDRLCSSTMTTSERKKDRSKPIRELADQGSYRQIEKEQPACDQEWRGNEEDGDLRRELVDQADAD